MFITYLLLYPVDIWFVMIFIQLVVCFLSIVANSPDFIGLNPIFFTQNPISFNDPAGHIFHPIFRRFRKYPVYRFGFCISFRV
jgi:hypothetical protein